MNNEFSAFGFSLNPGLHANALVDQVTREFTDPHEQAAALEKHLSAYNAPPPANAQNAQGLYPALDEHLAQKNNPQAYGAALRTAVAEAALLKGITFTLVGIAITLFTINWLCQRITGQSLYASLFGKGNTKTAPHTPQSTWG